MAWIRLVVLALAVINQSLVMAGLTPIPGDETVWAEVISSIVTVAAGAWAWFKNNYVTARGKEQRDVLQENGLIK
jgi:SPP1 family holin